MSKTDCETRGTRLLSASFILAIAIIATALASQYIGGLQPCQMCYWQRYVYYSAIPLAGLILLGQRYRWFSKRVLVVFVALLALVWLAGIGLSGFHAGVEWAWWEGPASCAGGIDFDAASWDPKDITPLGVSCSEPAIIVLGLSMAGYNFVMSIVLLLMTLAAARYFVARSDR